MTKCQGILIKNLFSACTLGTSRGGVNIFDKARERFVPYKHDPEDPGSLSHNKVNIIYRDNSGLIWLGTHDGLNLFHPDSKTFEVYKQYPDSLKELNWKRVSK